MTLSLINGSGQTCTATVNQDNFELRIYSGSDRIWSTKDCATIVKPLTRTLKAEQAMAWKLTWNGRRSRVRLPVATGDPASRHLLRHRPAGGGRARPAADDASRLSSRGSRAGAACLGSGRVRSERPGIVVFHVGRPGRRRDQLLATARRDLAPLVDPTGGVEFAMPALIATGRR